MVNTEKEWFVCAESGNRFQYPDGTMCRTCKRMVSTPFYLYVDMEPTCLKCKQIKLKEMLEALRAASK